ncbi:MAG: HAD family hydrolase [Thermoproteota archaeon]
MNEIKVVSLDVTGTLIDGRSIKHFWDLLIPKVYADENHVPFEEAFSYVKQKYGMISQDDVRWYLLEYWSKVLNIKKGSKELLEELRSKITFFYEVESAIIKLSSHYDLIISSNLPKEFLDIVLNDLRKHIVRSFSSVSDYHLPHKTAEFYAKVCSEMNVRPYQVLHVGDNRIYDYVIPKAIGMDSLLIKRYGNPNHEYEIKSLDQIVDRIRVSA